MTMKNWADKVRGLKKAVFLDRDGTINEDVGWLYEPEKIKFIEGAFKALKKFLKNYALYIITNQSGIGEGFFTEKQYRKFTEHYLKVLKNSGIEIKAVYHCPHVKEDNCVCRKPSPYFINKICKEEGIAAADSYMIGDHPHDIETAHNAGAKGIYVLTGHGTKHLHENKIKPDFTAASIVQAAEYILKENPG